MILSFSLLLSCLVVGRLAQEDDPVPATWQCGTDKSIKETAYRQIQTDCPALIDPINSCCLVHDKCYDDQKGQAYCDDAFCSCLSIASKPSKICHDEDTAFFCTIVKQFGGPAYENAGKNITYVDEEENDKDYPTYEDLVHEESKKANVTTSTTARPYPTTTPTTSSQPVTALSRDGPSGHVDISMSGYGRRVRAARILRNNK